METNEELRAKYNPEGSDLRRAQLRMLDMLSVSYTHLTLPTNSRV